MKPRFLVGGMLLCAACHTGDIDPMEQQPKLQEYEATRHFDNEMAMRTLVEGTVPRERDLSGAPPVTKVVQLGHEKFNQICTPCHGYLGDGHGSVANKMSLRQPPSLHDARRRALTSEWIFRAISEGYGLMPRFTTQLDTHERWAVVSYVRALQRSQTVDFDALDSAAQKEVESPPAEPAEPHGENQETGDRHEHIGHDDTLAPSREGLQR